MEAKQLKPAEIIRDEYGQWIHPEISKYWDDNFGYAEYIKSEDWERLKNYFNIQTVAFHLDGSVSDDDYEKMMDECDLSKWDPIAPTGFFLMSISFTEDDAVAIFAREIRKESEVA